MTADLEAMTPIVVVPPSNHWLAIIDKMIDKGVSPEMLSKVFEMQAAWVKEQQRQAFVAAFVAFKAAAPGAIERTGSVGFEAKGQKVGYKHVELDVACARLVPLLAEHDLSHSWETEQDATTGMITVTCRIEHSGGHSKTVTLRAMPDASGSKNAIQAVGSTVYYLQRYTFMAAIGMAQGGDDDGNGASPTEKVTAEQVAQLKELWPKKDEVANRWLAWAEVEEIEDIPRRKFGDVLGALKRAAAKVGEK